MVIIRIIHAGTPFLPSSIWNSLGVLLTQSSNNCILPIHPILNLVNTTFMHSNYCCIACNMKDDSSPPSLFNVSPLEDILLKLQRNVRNNSSQHSLTCLHSNYVTHTCVSLLNWLFPDISLTHSCLFPLIASPFQFCFKLINLIKKFNL